MVLASSLLYKSHFVPFHSIFSIITNFYLKYKNKKHMIGITSSEHRRKPRGIFYNELTHDNYNN